MIAALLGINALGRWWLGDAEAALFPLYEHWGALAFAFALAAFIVLLSVPFLPGVELGWALMMIAGAPGVALVYGAALFGLSLSFLAGRHIPLPVAARALVWLRFHRAGAWVSRLAPLPPQAQLELLLQAAPRRWVPVLVRHRYLALLVLLNLPGNTLLGGGGGIALLAGLSGLFTYPRFVAALALAMAPVPLLLLANARFVLWAWA